MNFKANTSYAGRFVTDADATLIVKVLKTTKSTVTIVDPHNAADTKRCKIYTDEGVQFIYPMGRYSMAPVVKADRVSA